MMELVQTVKITHKYGLHARASTKFVELAQGFDSKVFLSRPGGEEVDGKSVLGLLTLGVEDGHEVTVRVNGPDSDAAMKALLELIEADFNGV